MGECLRGACPCLETLWQRIFGDKKPSSPERDGGGGVDNGAEERDSISFDGEEDTAAPSPAPRLTPALPAQESGSIYTALWAFDSRHTDELSFAEGDLFSVVSRSGDWWTARRIDKNGRVLDMGIVPSNYLVRAESLEKQP